MKAIQTKYLPPTNSRGARLKADDGDGNSVTIPRDHALSHEEAHKAAAKALCDKMMWGEPTGFGMLGYVGVHTFTRLVQQFKIRNA